jgi:hypothetical protein
MYNVFGQLYVHALPTGFLAGLVLVIAIPILYSSVVTLQLEKRLNNHLVSPQLCSSFLACLYKYLSLLWDLGYDDVCI